MSEAALYWTRISHRRLGRPAYRFVYALAYCLLDIDTLDATARRLQFFGHNRFNLWSFHDCDHGDGGGLRAWAETCLRPFGVELCGGRIRLLTLPRVLGFVFNPISLWYCEHADGSLRAVIAEVNNTFGERHSYVLASGGEPLPAEARFEKAKCFHVSPFMGLEGRYRFALSAASERLRLVIHEYQREQPVMVATLAGERRVLNDRAILALILRMPWMTLKVVAAIHWQAVKIWWGGAELHRKPAPPINEVS